ncbi:MAG: ABC transporter permease [Limnochordia bacterium]
MQKRYLIPSLILLSYISLFTGVSSLRLGELLAGNTRHLQILLISRGPRLLSILFAGMSMGIAGLIMQQLSRNRFVSPTTAATVDAAKFGVMFALLFLPGASSSVKMLISFSFALGGSLLFMGLLRRMKHKNATYIPLVGLMLGGVIDAVTTFVAFRFDLVQNISAWLMGNFSMVIAGRYELLYLSIPLLFLAYSYAHQFTIAGMGEDMAKNLGLNYQLVMTLGMAIVSMISAVVLITVGRIPFLGLVVPNMVALYRGDNLRNNLGPTALLGAVFLLACDLFGRVIIAPYEIPIGLTVGVVGSILFLYLLFRSQRHGR